MAIDRYNTQLFHLITRYSSSKHYIYLYSMRISYAVISDNVQQNNNVVYICSTELKIRWKLRDMIVFGNNGMTQL
jgi:hypothetical protein